MHRGFLRRQIRKARDDREQDIADEDRVGRQGRAAGDVEIAHTALYRSLRNQEDRADSAGRSQADPVLYGEQDRVVVHQTSLG